MRSGTDNSASKLLLETEAAALLRCSRARLRRLRLSGLIDYYRTCPITISETDLADYIARAKINRRKTPTELLKCEKPKLPAELLTDAEAGERYGLSKGAISSRRAQKNGIPYLPGRPPLIDAQDLNEYFERQPSIKSEEKMRLVLLKHRVRRATKRSIRENEDHPRQPMTKDQRKRLKARLKNDSIE
jgi:hypothetical protein